MSDKVTTMVLKVDLQCSTCYKKIKKVLCNFPQIRNQDYDEKANTVKITVVCCNPEKMRDKLRCKGGKTITSIEIIKKTKEMDKTKVDGKPDESAGKGKETKETKVDEKNKAKEKQKGDENSRSRRRTNKFLRVGSVVGNVLKDIMGAHVIGGMEGPFHAMIGVDMGMNIGMSTDTVKKILVM